MTSRPFLPALLLLLLALPTPAAAAIWYVNDTSVAGDSFTAVVGSDLNDGLSPSTPKRTINAVMPLLVSGDTVFIDAGTYSDTDVTIRDTSTVWLTGADSSLTIITADWDTPIRVYNAFGITIENLQFTDFNNGIVFENAKSSVIRSDSFLAATECGVYVVSGSDSFTVAGCAFEGSASWDLGVVGSSRGAIAGNRFAGSGVSLDSGADTVSVIGNQHLGTGVYITNSNYDTVQEAVMTGNSISLTGAVGCWVALNTLSTNANLILDGGSYDNTVCTTTIDRGGDCFEISGDSNLIYGNAATGTSGGSGFRLYGGAEGNTLTGNTATGKSTDGFLIQGANNTLTGNAAVSNNRYGFYLASGGDTNSLVNNTIAGSGQEAVAINSHGNLVVGNTINGSNLKGLWVLNGIGNTLRQNHLEDNAGYALYLQGATNTVIQKNALLTSASQPDSAVFYDGSAALDLSRQWWNTADSSVIRARIAGAGADSAAFAPYRLGDIDTGLTADTVSPAAPDTVAAVTVDTRTIRVSWAAVAGSEEAEGAVNLGSFRIYASAIADTPSWQPLAQVGNATLIYDDGGRNPGETVWYRVTAIDSATPLPNESYFSATIAGGRTALIAGAQANADSVPGRVVVRPDTFAVFSVTVLGDTEAADTLTLFRAGFAGAPLDLDTVLLYEDAGLDGDWQGGDTPVGPLDPLGGGVFGAAGLAYPLPQGSGVFLVVVAVPDTATVGDTLRAAIPAFGLQTASTEPGPEAAVSGAEFALGSETQVRITVNAAAPAAQWLLPGDSAPVLAFNLQGDTAADDTLTAVAVGFSGAPLNAETVTLYEDAGGDALLGAADTLVGVLPAVGGGRFAELAFAYPLGAAARDFLVVLVLADTALPGDTLLAALPAMTARTTRAETGPSSDTAGTSVVTVSMDTSGANEWFVNDAATAGDSFTSTAGNDLNAGFARHVPKATLTAVMALLTAGDTVWLDVGTWSETASVGADTVWLIGADSTQTVIDPAGDSTSVALKALTVQNRSGVVLQTLGVRDAYDGLYLDNADYCRVESCSFSNHANGVNIQSTSSGDSILASYFRENNVGLTSAGTDLSIENNWALLNRRNFSVGGATGVAVTGNRSETATHATLGAGFFLNGSNQTVSNNQALGNVFAGLNVSGGNGSVIAGNTITGNQYGFFVANSTSGFTCRDNVVTANTADGWYGSAADNCQLTGNIFQDNGSSGVTFASGSDGNRLAANLIRNNTNRGVYISAGSNNFVSQNDIDSNGNYQVYIDGASSADTIQKNNLAPRWTAPTQGVYLSSADTVIDCQLNYWVVTNLDSVTALLNGSPQAISSVPYRLGPVDTAAAADTAAPAAPTGLGADASVFHRVVLTWAQVAANEDGTAFADFGVYHIYRSNFASDTDWKQQAWLMDTGATAADTWFTDTTVAAGETYYYRLTATDNAARENESWFSDTLAVFTGAANLIPAAAAGSDTLGSVGETLTVDGSGSDDPDTTAALTFLWSAADTAAHFGTATDSRTTVTFDTPGNYILTLAVSDGYDTGSDTLAVEVTSGRAGDFTNTNGSTGTIDLEDLKVISNQAGTYWNQPPADARTDLTGDGLLDFEDLALFGRNYGP